MRRSFAIGLAAIAALAFVLRLVYAVWIAPPSEGISDAFWFKQVGRLIAEGEGFTDPYELLFRGRSEPTAEHAPLYALVLAIEWTLGLDSDSVQRATGALFGTATVVLVGLVGRRIGGHGAGLAAAALAAVYPLLVTTDGAVLSETLYLPLVALSLLAAYRLRDRPTAASALGLGAAIGLAALTRSEALLLLPLLAAPAALGGGAGRERWLRLAACCAAAAVVVAPWLVRNWIVFDRPVLTNNLGGLIAQANCAPAYDGPKVGDVVDSCLGPRAPGDEADRAAHWRDQGLEYAGDHLDQLPKVAVMRLVRTFSFDGLGGTYDAESRHEQIQRAGVIAYYPLLLAAIAGAVLLWRRREPLALLLAPVAMAAIVSVAAHGSIRFRTAAEISLVLLAGVAVAALWDRAQGLSSARHG